MEYIYLLEVQCIVYLYLHCCDLDQTENQKVNYLGI
jgi:hypothetical protein